MESFSNHSHPTQDQDYPTFLYYEACLSVPECTPAWPYVARHTLLPTLCDL